VPFPLKYRAAPFIEISPSALIRFFLIEIVSDFEIRVFLFALRLQPGASGSLANCLRERR
jgi:hypothetical protein